MSADDVVQRIRRLLWLAEDARATEAEAAAALERAKALLIQHNLSTGQLGDATVELPPVTEHRVRTGWSGSWRGSLLGILARRNLCSPITSRVGRVDTVIVVGRPANVQATHAMYDWIAAQLEGFALEEWAAVNHEQRAVVYAASGVPWCPACEVSTETYRQRGRLWCERCESRVVPERPLIHGFTWKTAFYRGALLRITGRLHDQRTAQLQRYRRQVAAPYGPPRVRGLNRPAPP